MSDDDLKQLVEDLQGWFDGKLAALTEAAKNTEGLEKLTIKIQDGNDVLENINIELKTPEEVKAYRIGLYSAIGAMGEFPLTMTKKSEGDES